MKKLWLSVFDLAGIKVDAAAIDATDRMVVSEENLASIKTRLEECKGALEAKDKAEADLTALQEKFNALGKDKETADAAIATANTRISELEKQVKELGDAAGGTKTTSKKEENNATIEGLPSYCDQNLEIYQLLNQVKNNQ